MEHRWYKRWRFVLDVQLPAVSGVHRLKAFVVHSCEQGVSLMFCVIENKDRHLLVRYFTEINQQRGE